MFGDSVKSQTLSIRVETRQGVDQRSCNNQGRVSREITCMRNKADYELCILAPC